MSSGASPNACAVSRNVNREFEGRLTFCSGVADRVATFGGSWTFIIIFAAVLIAWVVINSIILARRNEAFDPYPYILLNLFLSMLAALQAPVIMMSQNRQAAKDRLDAAHDYEVNLKAELEVIGMQEKLDNFRDQLGRTDPLAAGAIQLLTRLLSERQTSQRIDHGYSPPHLNASAPRKCASALTSAGRLRTSR